MRRVAGVDLYKDIVNKQALSTFFVSNNKLCGQDLPQFTPLPSQFAMGNSEQTISIQPGYVLVERPQDYEVIWSEQQARVMEISALCKEAGCQKVLVLGPRTKVRLSFTDILSLGLQLGNLNLKVAVVELHDASNEDVSFLENVTANRGSGIQFFDNEQDAKDWLGIK